MERWRSKAVFLGPHMQTPHQQAFMQKAADFLDGAADFAFWRETLAGA